jgi:protein-tyrosine-phosphatase
VPLADPRAQATLRAHGYPVDHVAAEVDAELEDPYSDEVEGYERTFRMIERTMPELVRWARERSLARPVPGPYDKLDG